MSNQKISFEYVIGNSCCIIQYKGLEFVGRAQCHPDDMDFESERTGLCIAEARANIKLMKFKRNFEILPSLKSAKHLYTTVQQSALYDPKSHESKMIYRHLKQLEKQLDIINSDIAEEEKYLQEYIDKKDKFYKKLRAKSQ